LYELKYHCTNSNHRFGLQAQLSTLKPGVKVDKQCHVRKEDIDMLARVATSLNFKIQGQHGYKVVTSTSQEHKHVHFWG